MIDVNTSSLEQAENKASFILICGKKNADGVIPFGIGELVVNLQYLRTVSMSGKIRQDRTVAPSSAKR